MVKQFYTFACVLMLVACNSKREQERTTKNNKDTAFYWKDTLPHSIVFRPNFTRFENDSTTIELILFDTIPETISNQNPVTRFTYDSIKLSNNKFIFLTNADYAVVNNNGRHIYVAKVHDNSLSNSSETIKEVFKGNGYTITLTRKLIDHENGISYETGLLEIMNSRHKVIYKVHGGYRLL